MTPQPHQTGAIIPRSAFGKDHWSLLAYIESCCVDGHDGIGTLDHRRLRCNPTRHAVLLGPRYGSQPWKPEYGSRLFGYWNPDGTVNPTKLILDHDDWDALDDLEDAGLLTIVSLVNGFVQMTPLGLHTTAALRAHKATGGMFATFQGLLTPPAPET